MGLLEPTCRRTQTFRHTAAACRRNVDCNAGSSGTYWCSKEEASPHGQTSIGHATRKTACNVAPRETAPQAAAAKALGRGGAVRSSRANQRHAEANQRQAADNHSWRPQKSSSRQRAVLQKSNGRQRAEEQWPPESGPAEAERPSAERDPRKSGPERDPQKRERDPRKTTCERT